MFSQFSPSPSVTVIESGSRFDEPRLIVHFKHFPMLLIIVFQSEVVTDFFIQDQGQSTELFVVILGQISI